MFNFVVHFYLGLYIKEIVYFSQALCNISIFCWVSSTLIIICLSDIYIYYVYLEFYALYLFICQFCYPCFTSFLPLFLWGSFLCGCCAASSFVSDCSQSEIVLGFIMTIGLIFHGFLLFWKFFSFHGCFPQFSILDLICYLPFHLICHVYIQYSFLMFRISVWVCFMGPVSFPCWVLMVSMNSQSSSIISNVHLLPCVPFWWTFFCKSETIICIASSIHFFHFHCHHFRKFQCLNSNLSCLIVLWIYPL